jgi:hypothetical protein
MSEDKFDKTKENLGLTNLDNRSRKELYDKFVDAGGKVISEKEKRRQKALEQERAAKKTSSRGSPSKHTVSKTGGKSAKKKETKQRTGASKTQTPSAQRGNRRVTATAQPESGTASLLDRLYMRLKLKFSGVAQLNGLYFDKNFFKRFNDYYNPALLEIQILYMDIFRKQPNKGKEIISRLDAINPMYYELIEMAGNIYDKMKADEIVHHYVNFPDTPVRLSQLRPQLMELMKKLYVLRPYQNILLSGFEKAVDLLISMDGKATPRHNAMKRRARSELSVIFTSLYEKLHLLLCHYQGQFFEESNPAVGTILDVKEEDQPGKREKLQTGPYESDERTEEKEKEKEDKEEEEKVDPSVRKGLEMMSRVNLREARKEYDKSDYFYLVPNNDRVMMTYLYFKEFDFEYSTVMTSSAIKFKKEQAMDGTRKDYRITLNDLYGEMRKIYNAMEDYNELVLKYEKVRRQKPSGNAQYIEYTRRLDQMKKQRTRMGREVRMNVADYLKRVDKILTELIEDMDGSQRYIDNPQDTLEFNLQIEGNKKLHKKKIYQAFEMAHCYVAAFIYRLEPTGDLAGTVLPTGEEAEEESPEIPAGQEEKDQSTEENKSVLDELDDML